jgi:hypothetical protein
VVNPPGNDEMICIGILLKQLRMRFRSRIAILNSTAGHVTYTHLIAYMAEGGGETVRAFVSDLEPREWLKQSGRPR